ncbi:MAG: hypothetical protein IJR63_06230 [Synergistaceae bacterium]|nr:hypothetical protein [Synergistaceae bacterium]
MTRRKRIDLNSIFSSPLTLWIISVTLSVMMWIYVTGLEEAESITRKFSCPLEYRGLDSQAMLRGRLSEVDIEIRGTEAAIMSLNYDAVKAYVDARNLLPGKRYTVSINVECPNTVMLMSVFPSQTTLDIVRQVTRLMTVETVLPQDIPEGQYIDGVEIIPREVGLKGAEDDIAKVGSVRITPSIEELQKGTEQLIPVKLSQSEPFEGSVNIEPPQVRFRGTLARGLPRKRVPVTVRLAGKLDADYEVKSIATDPSDVQVEGKAEDLARVEAVNTEVIDISLMNADRVIVVPLRQPDVDGVTLPNASSVRVSIQLSEVRAEKMISHIPVELRGTASPEGWTVSPSSVTVTVEGRPSLIESFDPVSAGLRAYADMTNIFMSPVMLPVRTEIQSSDIFRAVRVEPQNITVSQ